MAVMLMGIDVELMLSLNNYKRRYFERVVTLVGTSTDDKFLQRLSASFPIVSTVLGIITVTLRYGKAPSLIDVPL